MLAFPERGENIVSQENVESSNEMDSNLSAVPPTPQQKRKSAKFEFDEGSMGCPSAGPKVKATSAKALVSQTKIWTCQRLVDRIRGFSLLWMYRDGVLDGFDTDGLDKVVRLLHAEIESHAANDPSSALV